MHCVCPSRIIHTWKYTSRAIRDRYRYKIRKLTSRDDKLAILEIRTLEDQAVALCAVNYPTFGQDDYEWIQEVRRRHDVLFFDVVEPHYTLVFPTEEIGETELIAHVTSVASSFDPFDSVLRCSTVGDPDFVGHAHAFLIPDEGFSDIVRLHDALYTGLLESELRLDLPFVPHIGIASTPDVNECKAIVDRLNAQRFEIRARVEKLDVIGYDGNKTWTIEEIPLGS